MVDALSMKVQEMHVASISIFQLDLRKQIANHVAEYELYAKVKDNLQ